MGIGIGIGSCYYYNCVHFSAPAFLRSPCEEDPLHSQRRRGSRTNGPCRLPRPYIFLVLCSPPHCRGNVSLCLRRRKRTSITGPLRMGAPGQLAALVPAGRGPPARSLPGSEPASSTENRPIVPLPGPKLARFAIVALSRIIL